MHETPPQPDPWQPRRPDPWHQQTPGTIGPPRPTEPVQDPPPPPLSETALTRSLIAWMAIVLFTLLTVFVQRAAMDLPALDPESLTPPGIQITVQAKVALGVSELPGQAGNRDQSMGNIRAVSQVPADQVRYVIMAAELYDAEHASDLIERFRAEASQFGLSPDELADLDTLEAIYAGQSPDAARAQRLIDRHGWFGELATSFNQPTTSPSHRSPRAAGLRVLIIAGCMGLFLALLGLAGFVLFIIAVIGLASGRFRARFAALPTPRDTPAVGESVAVFLGVFALGGLAAVYTVLNHQFHPGLVTLVLLTFCPLLPLCYGIGWSRYLDYTGLRRGEGLLKEVACGLFLYIAGLPVIALGFIISVVLFFVFPVELQHPTQDMFAGIGPWGLVLIVLLLVVWAPLVEEVLFRGLFYGFSRRWLVWPIASLVVGVVFAAIHPQWVWFIPGLASVGVVMALIREWRGSLVGAIAAHAFHNGMVATIAVAMLLA